MSSRNTANIENVAENEMSIAELALVVAGLGSGGAVGMVSAWPSAVEPDGYLECDGSIIDPVVYPKLASALGSNTLPDLRGEFIRGWDNSRGVDDSRGILTSQKGSLVSKGHGTVGGTKYSNSFFEAGSIADNNTGFDKMSNDQYSSLLSMYNVFGGGGYALSSSYNGVTRPKNIALMYIIKHD